jgi:hypothetical protein
MRDKSSFVAILALAVCLSTVLAAAASSAQSSPTAALTAWYDAAKKKDVAALKKLVSADSLKRLENPHFSVDDLLLRAAEQVPRTHPQTRNEKIDGDRATLEVRDDGKDRWETMHFVKESGVWKLSLGQE